MDSTANEVEGVNVRGYPTLIYYGKDAKEGKNYEGGRDFEALKSFVEEQAGLNKGNYDQYEKSEDKPADDKAADLWSK